MTDLPSASAGLNTPGEWHVELCFAARQELSLELKNKILAAMQAALADFGALSHTSLPAKTGRSGGILLTPQGLSAAESGTPGLSIIFGDSALPPDAPEVQQSLAQTWQWDEAEDAVSGALFRVTLNSVSTLELAPEIRIGLFQRALYALTKELAPEALLFPQSQCFIEPASYLENDPGDEDYFAIYGLVNTRIFTSDEGSQSVFMDTLGMHLLGLPDVQCLAQETETDFAELAYWMYNLVEYLRETPGNFEDGDSIVGLNDEEWEVSYSSALIEPERSVLNINTMQLDLADLAFEEEEGAEE